MYCRPRGYLSICFLVLKINFRFPVISFCFQFIHFAAKENKGKTLTQRFLVVKQGLSQGFLCRKFRDRQRYLDYY